MGLNSRDIEVLDKFAQNQLSEEDQVYFEGRLDVPEFKREVDFIVDLGQVSSLRGRAIRKGELQSLEANLKEKHSKSKYKKILPWIVILILILSFLYLLKIRGTHTPEDLYAQFYEPYPNLISPLRMGEEEVDPDVFQLYELKNYTEVIKSLKPESTLSEPQSFYLALSYLAIEDWNQSETILEKFTNFEGRFFHAARWYRALILLRDGKPEPSKEILNSIKSDLTDPYRLRAERLYNLL